MERKRKDDLARSVYEKRRSGLSFTTIGKEFGISKQRAQQIFRAEEAHIKFRQTCFYELSAYTRRKIHVRLGMDLQPHDISPQLVADTIFDGDLRGLGQFVHTETAAWLDKNGFTVKDGFAKYHDFNGAWRAVTSHLSDGRMAPWVLNRIYIVEAISRERARIQFDDQWLEIRLDFLKLGFSRVT